MIWEVNTGYLKPLLSENPEEAQRIKRMINQMGRKGVKRGEKDYCF